MIEALVYLLRKGGEVESRLIMQTELNYSNSRFSRVSMRLEALGLIRIERLSEAPPRTRILLTEKGRKVAEHFEKAIRLLQS